MQTEATTMDGIARLEAKAWQEYLAATREAGADYAEVEPWAWTRLRQRLRTLHLRRARLEASATAA